MMPSRSDQGEEGRKEGVWWLGVSKNVRWRILTNDLLSLSTCRHSGQQRELVPHGDVSDRLLHTHTGCKSGSCSYLCVKCMCLPLCVIHGLLHSSGRHTVWDGGRLRLGWWSVEGRDQRTHHAAQRGFWKRVSTGAQKSCCLFRYPHKTPLNTKDHTCCLDWFYQGGVFMCW